MTVHVHRGHAGEFCFVRVSRRNPCSICEKPDWCQVVLDQFGAVVGAACCRVESPVRWGAAGWFHRVTGVHARAQRFVSRPASRPCSSLDWADIAEAAWRAGQAGAVDALVKLLGVPLSALDALRVGVLSRELQARYGVTQRGAPFTFPMRDGLGRVVGVQLRTASGRKFALRGSRNGLFISAEHRDDDLVIVTEGQSDTAAAIGLGLRAVGIPGVRQCQGMLVEALRRMAPAEVVVFADADAAGRGSAAETVALVQRAGWDAFSVVPPSPMKDLREWVNKGASTCDVLAIVKEARLRPEAGR